MTAPRHTSLARAVGRIDATSRRRPDRLGIISLAVPCPLGCNTTPCWNLGLLPPPSPPPGPAPSFSYFPLLARTSDMPLERDPMLLLLGGRLSDGLPPPPPPPPPSASIARPERGQAPRPEPGKKTGGGIKRTTFAELERPVALKSRSRNFDHPRANTTLPKPRRSHECCRLR